LIIRLSAFRLALGAGVLGAVLWAFAARRPPVLPHDALPTTEAKEGAAPFEPESPESELFTVPPKETPDDGVREAFDLYKAGDPTAAARRLERAIIVSPSDTNAFLLLGKIHYEQGRPGPAVEALEAALRLNPGIPGAGELLERARSERGGSKNLSMFFDFYYTGSNRQAFSDEGVAEAEARLKGKQDSYFSAQRLNASFRGLSPEQARLAYDMSLSMVDALRRRHGLIGIAEFLKDLGQSSEFDAAFQRHFFRAYEDFFEEWKRGRG